MNKQIIIIILSCQVFISAQTNFSYSEFLPDGLNFKPLTAYYREAKIGLLYYPDNGNLKLDIGNSIDLFAFYFPKTDGKLTLGLDFMAYGLSQTIEGSRLKITALDGFFGGNAAYSINYDNSKLLMRFRIIHNSAHLVDGSFDLASDSWRDNYYPIPFTKDFGEYTIRHETKFYWIDINYYGSVSYATLVRPSELKKWAFNTGIEIVFPNLLGKFMDTSVNLFIADHIDFMGLPGYVGNNNLMGGFKFGEWEDKGIMVYASYYAGNNMFSEYYFERVEKYGFGFFIDFN